MDRSIAALRAEYRSRGLLETDADRDALRQLRRWFDDALDAGLPEPNAMIVSTVGRDGAPSARTVLLKDLDAGGLVFFTNYDSRKGDELRADPRAAAVLLWVDLERQVRVEGRAAPIPAEESDAYFGSRPRGSQIAAWASPQSRPVESRAALQRLFDDAARRLGDGAIPRPPHWGGYRIVPAAIEFWQGRPNRLHDRLRYTRDEAGTWRIERLAP